MASVNWEKYKSPTDAKAHMRHNEKQCRENTKEHSNQHIDKSKTQYNYSLMNRSYAERCKIYDDAMSDIQKNSKKALRKDAVTCIGLETTTPEQLTDDKIQAWFTDYHNILCDFFGRDNILDTDVHYDEIHEYIDSETHKKTMSRVHAHTSIIPRTADGRLCCKEISSRKNIIELNKQIEDMTQQKYGIAYNTGKTARKKSVEQLKADSLKLELAENQEKLTDAQQQVDTFAEAMKNAPKRKFKLFVKSEQHTMDEQEYADFTETAESILRISHNAVASDEEKQKAEAERMEAERLRKEQEKIINQKAQEQAEIIARGLVRDAVNRAKQREAQAEQREKQAEQMKQQYENEYNELVSSQVYKNYVYKKKMQMISETASQEEVKQPTKQTDRYGLYR